MSRTVAVANQKGGVAKTTTVVSLGAAFAEQSLRVLLVDLDAQACLTYSLGVDPEAVDASTHDLLLGKADASDVVVELDEGMDLVPAGIDLSAAESALLGVAERELACAGRCSRSCRATTCCCWTARRRWGW